MSLLTILTSNAWNILNFYQSFFSLMPVTVFFLLCHCSSIQKWDRFLNSLHNLYFSKLFNRSKSYIYISYRIAHIFLPELKHILAYNKKSIFDGITVQLSFHYKSVFAKTRVLTLTLGQKLRKSGQFFNLNTKIQYSWQ